MVTDGGTDTSEVSLLARLITTPCDGACESRVTEKLCCMPTARVPPLIDVTEGCVTFTVLEVTIVRPGAETVTAYWPVPVGVLSVTVLTGPVLEPRAGMVTWVGETVTMLDWPPVLASRASNVTVSGLVSTSPKQNVHDELSTKARMVWGALEVVRGVVTSKIWSIAGTTLAVAVF